MEGTSEKRWVFKFSGFFEGVREERTQLSMK